VKVNICLLNNWYKLGYIRWFYRM